MKKLFAMLLVAAMLFSLAACGTPTEPEPDESGDSYVQGVTDDKVIIANSAATSGAFAVVGVPLNEGIKAYLDMVNSNGGIDGRTIEFVHYADDEFDPVKGKAALEGITEDLGAFAVVGHMGTPVVAATVDDLKESGIPAVYFATGISQLYADGATTNADGYNLFPVQPLYTTEGKILAGYASSDPFNGEKVGVIYTNDDAGMDIFSGVEQAATAKGIEVVAEQVTAGAADVSAAVTSIKNAEVDVVIIASIQGTFPTIVKELAAQSVNKPALSSYVNSQLDMSDAIVGDIAGKFDVYTTAWVDASDPSDISLAFAEWIPEEYALNSFAMAGWIAAASFCEGLYRLEGKEVTWASYMAAMEESPIILPFGAAVDYAGGNRWGTQAMYLTSATPASEEWPLGWQNATEMTNLEDLLAA